MSLSNFISCEVIICVMVALGYINKDMLRANLNIAIVDMIEPKTEPNASVTHGNITYPYEGKEIRFRFTESQKHHLLFAYFWGYVLFDILGGYILDMVGPRKIFGISIGASGLVTAFTPLIGVYCGYYGLFAARVSLGILTGGIFPSAMPLAFKWFPKTQHHKFIAIMSAGFFGASISYPFFGHLVANYGWASSFYFTSGSNLVFCLLWFYFIYDSPEAHPRMSNKVKLQILAKVDSNKGLTKNRKVPWKKLLTSKVIWTVMFAYGSSSCVHFFLLSQLPYYMNRVHGLDIRKNGALSSLPLLAKFIFCIVFGYIADALTKSKKFKTITVRKMFATIALLVEPVALILQGFFGYMLVPSILVFILSFICGSARFTSSATTILDVSPSYSGTITTCANTISSLILISITEIFTYFTKTDTSFGSYSKVFFILAGIEFCAWVLFMKFADVQTKTWNFVETENNQHELTRLNENKR